MNNPPIHGAGTKGPNWNEGTEGDKQAPIPLLAKNICQCLGDEFKNANNFNLDKHNISQSPVNSAHDELTTSLISIDSENITIPLFQTSENVNQQLVTRNGDISPQLVEEHAKLQTQIEDNEEILLPEEQTNDDDLTQKIVEKSNSQQAQEEFGKSIEIHSDEKVEETERKSAAKAELHEVVDMGMTSAKKTFRDANVKVLNEQQFKSSFEEKVAASSFDKQTQTFKVTKDNIEDISDKLLDDLYKKRLLLDELTGKPITSEQLEQLKDLFKKALIEAFKDMPWFVSVSVKAQPTEEEEKKPSLVSREINQMPRQEFTEDVKARYVKEKEFPDGSSTWAKLLLMNTVMFQVLKEMRAKEKEKAETEKAEHIYEQIIFKDIIRGEIKKVEQKRGNLNQTIVKASQASHEISPFRAIAQAA